MLNRRKKHVHSTQPVKEQKLLDKCKDWQGRKRIPKRMLQPKSTSYTQTLEIPIFRMSIYPTECDWHWNSRHSKSQPNLLVISLTVHFASDMHFSIRKQDNSSSVIVYGSSNQKKYSTLLLWTFVATAEFTPKLLLYRRWCFRNFEA